MLIQGRLCGVRRGTPGSRAPSAPKARRRLHHAHQALSSFLSEGGNEACSEGLDVILPVFDSILNWVSIISFILISLEVNNIVQIYVSLHVLSRR